MHVCLCYLFEFAFLEVWDFALAIVIVSKDLDFSTVVELAGMFAAANDLFFDFFVAVDHA